MCENESSGNSLIEQIDYKGILNLAEDIYKIKEKFLEDKPINVISLAARGKLKEIAHSAILQIFLKNEDILHSFIDNVVGISCDGISVEDVEYPDKDRIDISISGEKFIIIENKVNSADEKDGQIYRYVQLAKE